MEGLVVNHSCIIRLTESNINKTKVIPIIPLTMNNQQGIMGIIIYTQQKMLFSDFQEARRSVWVRKN